MDHYTGEEEKGQEPDMIENELYELTSVRPTRFSGLRSIHVMIQQFSMTQCSSMSLDSTQ